MCDDPDGQYNSLRRLDLHCFDPAECPDITPFHISTAIYFGNFKSVRRLGVHRRLGWRDGCEFRDTLEEIDRLLRVQAEEDGPEAEIPEVDAGVRYYGTMVA